LGGGAAHEASIIANISADQPESTR
jgi:hypothetical protein